MLFHHVCIQTNCYQKSLDFYTRIFGMDLVEETAGFHGRAYNTWLKKDGFMIELQTAKQNVTLSPASKNNEGIVHMCFLVSDLEETCRTFQEKGFQQFDLHGDEIIYEVKGGRLFKLITPEGTIIEFRDNPNL